MPAIRNHSGIILKFYPVADGDLIVHLVLTDGSRLQAYAKAARKSKSRKSTSIDILNHIVFSANDSKTTLPYMQEVKLLNSPRTRISSLHGLISLQFISEVFDKFILPEEPNPILFILLQDSIDRLSNSDNYSLMACVMLKILENAGNLPDLSIDTMDEGTELNELNRILSPEIGYTSSQISNAEKISDRLYKSQQFIIRTPIEDNLKLKLEKQEWKKLFDIHLMWLQQVTQSPIRSASMLRYDINK